MLFVTILAAKKNSFGSKQYRLTNLNQYFHLPACHCLFRLHHYQNYLNHYEKIYVFFFEELGSWSVSEKINVFFLRNLVMVLIWYRIAITKIRILIFNLKLIYFYFLNFLYYFLFSDFHLFEPIWLIKPFFL